MIYRDFGDANSKKYWEKRHRCFLVRWAVWNGTSALLHIEVLYILCLAATSQLVQTCWLDVYRYHCLAHLLGILLSISTWKLYPPAMMSYIGCTMTSLLHQSDFKIKNKKCIIIRNPVLSWTHPMTNPSMFISLLHPCESTSVPQLPSSWDTHVLPGYSCFPCLRVSYFAMLL